jgi:hypothetical protein
MKTMTPQQITRIEAIIKQGRTKYVILNGVIGWGLLTATLFVIWTYFTKTQISPKDVIIPFILFPIGGIFWGLFMWHYFKRRIESSPRDQK